jgi:hypothetical protein
MSLAANGDKIFAGTVESGVFFSANNGAGWTAANAGLATHTVFRAFAVKGDTIFAGADGGGVFFSADDGKNWTAVNAGLKSKYVWSLAISGSALFAGIYGGGVFLSTNNGTSWTEVNNGLTNLEVWSLAVSDGTVFAGTDEGHVFQSANNGTQWTEVNSGLPIKDVTSLAVSGGTIFAGTFSAGIWHRPLSEMTGAINHASRPVMRKQTTLDVYALRRPSPDVIIGFSLVYSEQVSVKIYNLSGHEVATLVNKHLVSGSYSINWDTRNIALGCYLLSMQAGLKTFVRSIPIFR